MVERGAVNTKGVSSNLTACANKTKYMWRFFNGKT